MITEPDSREGIVASISRILAFGASVRVELNGFDDKLYEVELTRNQLQDLAIKTGQQVRLRPIQVRVFAKD
ncbi:MAG: TOBE-like domain-containing protein [Agitococcus sp.]|nr:TOBE-like domain-containing protein [Agitococcus sp.]